MCLNNTLRAFLPKAAEHTFFSSAYRTFYRWATCLDTKKVSVNLRRLKSYQSSIFSDHNHMILEINYKEKHLKTCKHVEAK